MSSRRRVVARNSVWLREKWSYEIKGQLIIFVLLCWITTFSWAGAKGSLSAGNRGSFLWRVEMDPPSYFFGTIHVPYTRVWEGIPANAKIAFAKAEKIYFELDLTSPRTLSSLSACQLLPEGRHLSQVIPSEVYHRLRLHLDYVRRAMVGWLTEDQVEEGIQADHLFSAITANWERMQPMWIVLMINSLTKSDVGSRGFPMLDLYLSQLAERQSKTIGAIESVEEQCEPLNGLNATQEIFVLNQTLIHAENVKLGIEKPSFSTDKLVRLYRQGNLDAFYFNQDAILNLIPPEEEESSDYHEASFSKDLANYFRTAMIVERNKRMAARVIDLLVNQPEVSYFFAFGAGHFIGNNTILDIVRSAGFPIRHLSTDDRLAGFAGGGSRHPSQMVVYGTFDDLPQEEKTKAFLTFLQYRQQLEGRSKQQISDPGRRANTDEELEEDSLRVFSC